MTRHSTVSAERFLVVLLLLGAFALRLYRLDAVNLRGDEAFAAVSWTQTPFSPGWFELLRTEPNPGGVVLTWGWTQAAGTTEFALRCLPLLADVFGLAGTLALARALLRRRAPVFAAGLLYALHPLLVWHAQDARVYSLVAALTPLSTLLLLRAARRDSARAWGAFALAQLAALYLFYLDALWVAARGVYLLVVRRVTRRALLAALVGALLCLPLVAQIYAVAVVSGYGGTADRATPAGIFDALLPALLLGEQPPTAFTFALGVLLAGGALVGAWRFRRGDVGRRGLLLALSVGVPLALFLLLSTRLSLFKPRYVIALVPFVVIGVAAALFPPTGKRRLLRAGAFALLVALMGARLVSYFYLDPPKAPDWRGLAAYLHARAGAGGVVVTGDPDLAIQYYYSGALYYIQLDEPERLAGDLAALLDAHDAVFLLAGDHVGAAQVYLGTQAQHIPGDTYPGVGQYRAWTVKPGEIQHPLDVRFGDVAALRGYALLDGGAGTPGSTGASRVLLLYWEALRQTTHDTSVLLHLAPAPDAPPDVVLDHGIAAAQVTTRAWQPGVLYRDPLLLPPGEYVVLVGMYDTATQRAYPTDAGETRRVLLRVGP